MFTLSACSSCDAEVVWKHHTSRIANEHERPGVLKEMGEIEIAKRQPDIDTKRLLAMIAM